MTWRSVSPLDRFLACLPYLLPLIEVIRFGTVLFRQFPSLQLVFLPIVPILSFYNLIPFAGLIIFFALYLLVVRNENVPHFIRFNAMQAILLDIVLVLCSLVLSLFTPLVQGGLILDTLYNVIFLGTIAAVVYSVIQSALGRYAEIPTLSNAVYMQVR